MGIPNGWPMHADLGIWILTAASLFLCAARIHGRTTSDAPLPPGARAVWSLGGAWREATPTRERVCLNGLWRWQPSSGSEGPVPTGDWGYFKVPGPWPGITDYMQKDCQTVHAHPGWGEVNWRGVRAAWYQREITIPRAWRGRRIALRADYLNSYAAVYLDGKRAGEMRFPSGEVDLTSLCRPGGTFVLSAFVLALPLKGVVLSYHDTNSAREVEGTVARRGFCGDVFLVSEPPGARIGEVGVVTSVRDWRITFRARLANLKPGAAYALRAEVLREGRRVAAWRSRSFGSSDLEEGRFAFAEAWRPPALWDLHTPENQYEVRLSLVDGRGRVLDTSRRERFGFREFRIEGRDFHLNGTRVHLSAVPLDNAQVGAGLASYEGALESLKRLKGFGINFVYTHNYGCEPGTHLSFSEVLRAADDAGMLVALSQPHFGHYDWETADAEETNGYASHAAFFVRAAGNHPSVVAYATSHNSTGYHEDMNPDMIDGTGDPRGEWAGRNVKRAVRAEAILRRLDPDRIVYHHSSGNLGSMHTSNFYPNFVPIQEMSDWFEHWAESGVKPVFLCEYGAPFTWDWTMYRGWYQGNRSFGSARVPWEFCLAEWSAQFLGDSAYDLTAMEKENLRWEAAKFRAGEVWHRWDYPHNLSSRVFQDRHTIIGMYTQDNWRAFRTWGVSANSPWEHGHFWDLKGTADRGRSELPVDWERLQRPGFSPDYIDGRYERMDLAFDASDWIPTAAGGALLRNNMPLLGYIAGKPERHTSKDHLFLPGERFEKQMIAINDSRETVTCDCAWSLDLPSPREGGRTVTVPTGDQARVPVAFDLPADTPPGAYRLAATFRFGSGETQRDTFEIRVMPPAAPAKPAAPIALYDPVGQTAALLDRLGIGYRSVAEHADLSSFRILAIGKGALSVEGPGPDIGRVREGLKVILFEQTAAVLERRLGFRVAEYGLRRVYPRVPDHPLLAGLEGEHLRDWRGEATLLPSRLTCAPDPRRGPTVKWCDIDVPRLWRCGCRGNVASVLIEKPAKGDFLPVVDGGYALQYSPLMVHREGDGMILFCQMDVTGRTEADPAAEALARNLFRYVSEWRPAPSRRAVYAGDPAGRAHLESAGIPLADWGDDPAADVTLIVGPGGGEKLSRNRAGIQAWMSRGGGLVAVGLGDEEANRFLPFRIRTETREHIGVRIDPPGAGAFAAGIGPADLHNRDPREAPFLREGVLRVGEGLLGRAEGMNAVFFQVAPWGFDPSGGMNLKRTFRRVSFALGRLLANAGISGFTPLPDRIRRPVIDGSGERRWLEGLYFDTPEEWDDPYRFFRW